MPDDDGPRGAVSWALPPGLSWYVRNPDHGPLPALLLLMTLSTGIIDAVSILGLGRVFVANMTGNVVFTGLALAGAPGFSLAASLVALAGFLLGASAGGGLVRRSSGARGRLLRSVTIFETVLMAAALVVAAVAGSGSRLTGTTADVVAALSAIAMGLQNTMARYLAVPDLTTSVLTMTLTGLAADLRSGITFTAARRIVAVVAMGAGAVIGGLLVINQSVAWGLAASVAVLAAAATGAVATTRRRAPWQRSA
jgi:uncharacterized membrane protein YoaK (UPF0700 family)